MEGLQKKKGKQHFAMKETPGVSESTFEVAAVAAKKPVDGLGPPPSPPEVDTRDRAATSRREAVS